MKWKVFLHSKALVWGLSLVCAVLLLVACVSRIGSRIPTDIRPPVRSGAGPTIEFDVTLDAVAAPFGPWMFDKDPTPYTHDMNCPTPNDCGIYAFTKLAWNSNAAGNGQCGSGGSGHTSAGTCTSENTNVLDGIAGVTIEFHDFVLSNLQKKDWEVLGQTGDHRVYSNGTVVIKANGEIKLKMTDCRITMDVDYPTPAGPGDRIAGCGWGTIDKGASDQAWATEFNNGTDQLEFAFSSFNAVVQHNCYSAYQFHVMVTGASHQENGQVRSIHSTGRYDFEKAGVSLWVYSYGNGGPNHDLNSFFANKVMADPGGELPMGIAQIVPHCYWELGTDLEAITATVTLDHSSIPNLEGPLVVLRRDAWGGCANQVSPLWHMPGSAAESPSYFGVNVSTLGQFALGVATETVSKPYWMISGAELPCCSRALEQASIIGAHCNRGNTHEVQYRVDWGDGPDGHNYADWLLPTDPSLSAHLVTFPPHTFTDGGIYLVRAQARCATHTQVESEWSEPKRVSVGPRNIEFDIQAHAGGRGPWMFDLDATPYTESGSYYGGVHAYKFIGKNTDPEASGLASFGIGTNESTNVLNGIAGVTLEMEGFRLSDLQKKNWEVLGQTGDNRVYSNGTISIKVDDQIKLKLIDCRITLGVNYPAPVGPGDDIAGSGWGTIDETSDSAWKMEFDNGSGQAMLQFSSLGDTVQGEQGTIQAHVAVIKQTSSP